MANHGLPFDAPHPQPGQANRRVQKWRRMCDGSAVPGASQDDPTYVNDITIEIVRSPIRTRSSTVDVNYRRVGEGYNDPGAGTSGVRRFITGTNVRSNSVFTRVGTGTANDNAQSEVNNGRDGGDQVHLPTENSGYGSNRQRGANHPLSGPGNVVEPPSPPSRKPVKSRLDFGKSGRDYSNTRKSSSDSLVSMPSTSGDEGPRVHQRARITAPGSDHVTSPAPRVSNNHGRACNNETECNISNQSAMRSPPASGGGGPSQPQAAGDQRLPGKYQRRRGNVIDIDIEDSSDDDQDIDMEESEEFDNVDDVLGYKKVVSLPDCGNNNYLQLLFLITLLLGLIVRDTRIDGLNCVFKIVIVNFNFLKWLGVTSTKKLLSQPEKMMMKPAIKLMMNPMMSENIPLNHQYDPP